MFRKTLLYGLPVYLYGLELLLKTIANVTANSLAGPTLAGAGMGFLLPLTALKPVAINDQLAQALSELDYLAYSPRDKTFTELVWVTFLVFLGGWMYSIHLTMQQAGPPQSFNWPLLIGCVTFALSIVLCEVKERI